MELSQEFLIDMAINAGGYLLAGLISVFLYSLFQKKKPNIKIDETVDEVTFSQAKPEPTGAKNYTEQSSTRKVEFITFGSEVKNQRLKPEPVQRTLTEINTNGRMSRKEAINLAKKMLEAGATPEKIKKVLPVSDSELALLSLNIN